MKDNRYDEFEEFDYYDEDDDLNIYYDDRRNYSSRKNNKKHHGFRRIAAIGLAAALACGIVAGGFQGIAALRSTPVLAAAETNEPVKLLRTAAETEKEDTEAEAEEGAETEVDIEADEKGASVKGSLDVSDIAEEVLPSIVSITTKSVQEMVDYYSMFGYYGYAPEYEQEVEGAGSGFIVNKNDTELLIVTNYHVVEDANSVSVGFIDNEVYEAKVKGYDENKDLAVVAVQLDDIKTSTLEQISLAKVGSSDALKVGEQVVAIGNAMGYGQSVTTGIVSAKNRRLNEEYETEELFTDSEENEDALNLIQTDAAINPGNSGGALLNMDGEVVGINSAKLMSTGVEGMGYAIAIDDVAEVIENLMNQETRDRLEADEHGVMGILAGTVSSTESQRYGFPQGAYVQKVNEGSAAEAAGIPEGSVIVAVDGKSIKTADQLVDYLFYYAPGEEVEITYAVANRGEFEEETVTVTLAEQTVSDSDDEDDDEEDSMDEEEDRERSREEIMEDWGNGSFGNFGEFGGFDDGWN